MRYLTTLAMLGFLALFSCETNDFASRTYADFEASGPGIFEGEPGDEYEEYQENDFINVLDEPISTFSIDADGASYANVRRFLTVDNMIPPKGAIRSEELVNYFDLDYPFESTYDDVLNWLNGVNLPDQHGFKQEFKQLVQQARDL